MAVSEYYQYFRLVYDCKARDIFLSGELYKHEFSMILLPSGTNQGHCSSCVEDLHCVCVVGCLSQQHAWRYGQVMSTLATLLVLASRHYKIVSNAFQRARES